MTLTLARDADGVAHIVALSGGKDSTAMALELAEREPRPYNYVCTPTGNELPSMFAHWKRLGELLCAPLLPVVRGTLVGEIERQHALPNFRMRWCTRALKIEPYAAFLAAAGRCVSYVGLRADEQERQGGDYAAIPGVVMRFPMREWGWKVGDVRRALARRGVEIPDRTDCGLCFFQQIGEWYDLWEQHPDAWAEGERLEALTGHTFRSPGRDTWPVGMADLAAAFAGGRIPKARRNLDLFREATCRVCRI